MRPRKKNRHLPPCVYQRHGAYYHVKAGKWTRIGTELAEVYEYCKRQAQAPAATVAGMLDLVLADAETSVKPNTLKAYRMYAAKLKTAFREFSPAEVRPRHIEAVLEHHKRQPNSANMMHSLLKMAFRKAVLLDLCVSNPVLDVQRLKPPKRTRYLTDEEYRRIYAQGSEVLQVIMDMAYLTGQRIGDVLRIRISDITDEGIVFRQEKTGKRLCVALSPALEDAIARAKALHGRTSTLYLLARRNGQVRGYTGVWSIFDRARTKAGVQDATIHDLRAKALTDAKKQGKDPQALGGHSTEAMTNRYLRSRETVLVEGPSFNRGGDDGKTTERGK